MNLRKTFCHRFVIFSLLILLSANAWARKFDFGNERMAGYIRGTLGNSTLSDKHFNGMGPTGVTHDNKVDANYSGDFGFIFATNVVNFRLGLEMLVPKKLSDLSGTTPEGVQVYTLESKLVGYLPQLTIEYVLHASTTTKILIGGGGGMAYIYLDNAYRMTAAGTAAYGLSDFTAASGGTGTILNAFAGFEFLFTDTVTMMIDGGYRSLVVDNLTYKNDHVGFSGAKVRDGDVRNNDGSKPRLDLSGPYAGLAFRFYIPI